MYTLRLARSIEEHREEIATDTIRHIRQDKEVPHMVKISDQDLRDWVGGILSILPTWPGEAWDAKASERFQNLGKRRFEFAIPLHEAVRCLLIMKQQVFDYARSRGFAQNAMEIYAQEELEHHMGRLFDRLVYHVVRGYEEAREVAARSAA